MQSNSFLPSQRSSPQRGKRRLRTAPSQLQLLRKPSLAAKIETLDAFQYRSRKTPSDTIAVLNLLETKQNCGMHVSELWSTKQHQHFLRSLQAFEAQKVREQMERERLFNARVKQVPGRTLDVLYERLTHSDHPAAAVKTYALGRPGFVMQEITAGLKAAGQFRRLRVSRCQGGSRPGTPRTQTINSLIKQCDDLALLEQELMEWRRSTNSDASVSEVWKARKDSRASPIGKFDLDKQYISPLVRYSDSPTFASDVISKSEHDTIIQQLLARHSAALESERQSMLKTLDEKLEALKLAFQQKEKQKVTDLRGELETAKRREQELIAALQREKDSQEAGKKGCEEGEKRTVEGLLLQLGKKDEELALLQKRLKSALEELHRSQSLREEAESAYRQAALELNEERLQSLPDTSSDLLEKLTAENSSLKSLHKSDQELIRRLRERCRTDRSHSPLTFRPHSESRWEDLRSYYESQCLRLKDEREMWKDKAAALAAKYRTKLKKLRSDCGALKDEVVEFRETVKKQLHDAVPRANRSGRKTDSFSRR